MLAGSTLLTSQLDLREIHKVLNRGDAEALLDIEEDTVTTVKHVIELLAKAPLTQVIKLLSKSKHEEIEKLFSRCEGDADYTQHILRLMGNKKELNPVMNAVCEAFSRRRWQGSFKSEGRSIELDTLLFDHTKGDADDDSEIPASSTRKTESRSISRRKLPPLVCFDFQRKACWRGESCRYKHVCANCDSPSHGRRSCALRKSGAPISAAAKESSRDKNTHPHPRFRRDRATNFEKD